MRPELAVSAPVSESVSRPLVSRAGRWPAAVIAWQTARKAVRSGALWGYVFGAYVATSAFGYAVTYKTPAAREKFAATFGSNVAINALIGPARQLQTVAGFTVWRCLGVLSIVGAVWGLLTSTRLLRGEEDAGRWELLLSGQTTRRRAVVEALFGLGAGLFVLWALTAVITVLVGRSSKVNISPSSALFLAVTLVAPAAVFLASGALASQLAATRRQAAGYAATLLGAFYALRMVADSGTGLQWLRWLTPLGWVEELKPFTSPRPLVLIPIIALVLVLASSAAYMSGRRDLGASTLPDRATSAMHPALLSGPTRLAVRLVRASVIAWCVGIAAGSLLIGFVSKQAGNSLKGNTSVGRVLARLGAPGLNAETYLGVGFLIAAIMVAFLGAGLLGSTRAEEADGHIDHLLARPVSRSSWIGGRLAVTTVALVLGGLGAGVFAWLGAASQHSGVSVGSLVAAGMNVVPPAMCVLGIGALTLGVRPRATSAVVYGLISWALLVEIIGGAINLNHWVLDTSVFHQMTAAPAISPNWSVEAVLAAVGVAAGSLGVLAFGRRDLAGE